ncbi:hypothetical protein [Nocardia sp. X0981]
MSRTTTDPLILAAEQADAEAAAAEAEAVAAQASATAARARARAARLRRAAAGPGSAPETETVATDPAGAAAPVSDHTAAAAPTGTTAAAAAPTGTTAAAAAPTGTTAGGGDTGVTEAGDTEVEAADTGAGGTVSAGPRSAGAAGAEVRAAGTVEAEPADTAPDPGAHAEPAPKGTVRGRFAKRLPRVPVRALPRPSGRVLGRIAAAVVIVVSLGAGGFTVWNHYRLTAEQARADEYLEAARAGVIALTSLDSTRAADDVRRVLDHSTGAFRTDFQSRSEDFTKVVAQSRVATRGEITAAAVESMTEESAVVLVSAVSKVTNSAGAQEEPRVWRLSVTVTRDGSAVKMSKVEFVP